MEKYIYELDREGEMKVPAKVFASKKIWESIKKDKTIEQVKNVAKLPGIIGHSIALPDAHQGYGFSIGGVAAFDLEKGIISPGGVGYDINCSVRLLKTNILKKNFLTKQKEIEKKLIKKIPSGLGGENSFRIDIKELDKILKGGSKYLVEKGFGIKEDYALTEENGCMENANPKYVSQKAKSRGIKQLGTLGSGNHFLDVLSVEEIFDKKVAEVFGLKKNQIVILIHCGSRGLGHQIATDYIKKMRKEKTYGELYDQELVYAPIKSKIGKEYFSAMACAANFAFANKQIMTHEIRKIFSEHFPNSKVNMVYDICHNIAKIEEHTVNGKKKKLCVHRKGATRSLGPNQKGVPKKYKDVGQPVLIPGSMGTSSFVMVGDKNAAKLTFSSSVHGAGRVLSRTKAMRKIKGEKILKELNSEGISVNSSSLKSVSQEAPSVYKNIDEVIEVIHSLKISRKVARLFPLVVIMG